MKTILLLALLSVPPASVRPAESQTRCYDIKPICNPGKQPICLCESEYSYNCKWVCASKG